MAPAGIHRLSNSRVDESSNVGTLETQAAGGGNTGYLMRIPKEWYDSDKKDKAARIEATEQGLKTPQTDGTYGSIKINEK
jgi:hypothetical protein